VNHRILNHKIIDDFNVDGTSVVSPEPSVAIWALSAPAGGENTEPRSVEELGLSEPFLESLVSRVLLSGGNNSGRGIAAEVCLPFRIVEATLERLRARRLVTHCGSGNLNDYVYGLTDDGRTRARTFHAECAYVGPAPVPLTDYVISVEAQAI